jgi:predicted PurR-regulated permease PerM
VNPIRARLRLRRRHEGAGAAPPPDDQDVIEIEPGALSGVFAAPSWLRDVGFTAWLLVGVALFLVGAVWLMSLTQVIVVPVIAAAVIAAVASPLVGWLKRHGLPRVLGAVLVMLGIVGLGLGLFVLIIAGITSELSSIEGALGDAKNTLSGWLQDIGVDQSSAENAKNEASSSVSDAGSSLLHGLGAGIAALSGLAFFLALTALSLFFLLSDGPTIRRWAEGHLGVPPAVGHVIGQRTLGALRGYFLGVTIVAAFNGVVVLIGALILDIPLAGTIGAVTFLGAYIPYLGAWSAGAFAVLMALGGAGPDAAGGMIVVQLLANGVLQQLVQPFAMGAALGIHPLAVLIVTIAGGALFGVVGLILAAPLVSATIRISEDLSRAEAEEAEDEEASDAPSRDPVSPGTPQSRQGGS